MAAKKKPAKKKAPKKKKPAAPAVLSWEDDPLSLPSGSPVQRPVPNVSDPRLAIRIEGPKPEPKIYPRGTKEFRYWTAAEALRRAADYWGGILPGAFTWQVGSQLPVHLDQGVDLNAFYTRGGGGDPPGLSFFHDTVNGTTYFSAESPEVTCHEFGHAVLDALRPQLFNVAFIEAASFHEAFGDMTAILCVLQLQSMRVDVIGATGGKLARNSRVSRLAEQLGFAIRVSHPDVVDADSLRNAANTFFYRDPHQLPPSAPATLLSSEPHSFSRVFTAAFLEILAGIFTSQGTPGSEQQLLASTKIAGQLLAGAVMEAPVVPAYYSQIAAHFLSIDAAQFSKKYRDVIKAAFVRHGILSLDAVSSGVTDAQMKAAPKAFAAAAAADRRTQTMALPAKRFGLDTLVVAAPASAPRFAVAPAAPSIGELETPSRETAAQSFVEDLFRRGRIEMHDYGDPDARVCQPFTRKTHELVGSGGAVELQRRFFDCGFTM
jgi:hypothetical protein